jgi:hypothetical protein
MIATKGSTIFFFFSLSDAVLGARCDARSSTSIRPLPPDA